MRIASSTPLLTTLQHDNETYEESAARDTEEFIAHLAYTVQNENEDGYFSPDDESVRITAKTVFDSQDKNGYLHPDLAPQPQQPDLDEFLAHMDDVDEFLDAQSDLDDFLANLVYGSPNDPRNGYLSPDEEPVQITAHMMSGDEC
jgi:hypothetical protein